MKNWWVERREQGICRSCEEKVVPGRVRCPACADKKRESDRRRYKQKKQAGLCVKCGIRGAEPSHVFCKQCSSHQAEFRSDRRKMNREKCLCNCGRVCLYGKHTCEYHTFLVTLSWLGLKPPGSEVLEKMDWKKDA